MIPPLQPFFNLLIRKQNRFKLSFGIERSLIKIVFRFWIPAASVRNNRSCFDLFSKLDDGEEIHYLDIGELFLDADGNIPRDVMSDGLHPTTKGYEIWAEAVEEPLAELVGGELAVSR